MPSSRHPRRRARAAGLAVALVALVAIAAPSTATAAGQFTFLAPGFTQDLWGTQPSFMGGIAIAPDGDPVATDCQFSGSALRRFDSQTLLPPFNGTSTLHPRSDIPSNAGCGITQGGGAFFSNTSGGVTKLDPNTGATLGGPAGPGGNALGIAVDPVTQRVVWVGSGGTIHSIKQDLTDPQTFSTALNGHFIDGIFFDPTGAYLFTADRSGSGGFRLTILDANGALVQSVPTPSEPDGIAFHASAPKFVVANNTDGTITRYDFPGDDFTKPPTLSSFASGGFRGDITQVGNDGCLYVSQDNGTRYDNGATDSNSSMVRICPGFAPPAGVEGPPGSLTCKNNVDDDGDGKIDQADPDCQEPEGPIGGPKCSDGVDNDGDGATDAADSDCVAVGVNGRMTSNATKDGVKYASIVDCTTAAANAKNRPFYVEWSSGTKQFKATSYSSLTCNDDPGTPGVRPAGFDRQVGVAQGTLNGVSGYRLEFTLVDGGSAAGADKVNLRVSLVSGDVTQKTLTGSPASGAAHQALTP